MSNGVFALLERSLRIDVRSTSTHVVRFFLMIAIYVPLCVTSWNRFNISAPGLSFFQAIASLDAGFLTLLGIGFFSTAITEEKEEDTLGLMMMAGISPLGILLGKSIGRLLQALLLLGVQYPFMLLAVTMGGVTRDQIWAMTAALLAYMLFLSGLGLLCSTIASRSRSAGLLMIVGLAVYILVPVWAMALIGARGTAIRISELNGGGISIEVLDAIIHFSVFVRISEILASGYADSAWALQVYGNVILGLICAAFSWVLFGVAIRNPSVEMASRGLVARKRGFLRFPAGRAWINPFAWKDFYFVAGGFAPIVLRFVFYVGLVVAAWSYEINFNSSMQFWVMQSLTFIMLALPVDAALLVARSLHDENRGQTLTSLMTLPSSPPRIVYSKLGGTMLGWFPGPLVGLSLLFGTEAGRKMIEVTLNHHERWIVVVGFLYLALVPHYAALAALYVRWGAVPLAIGLTIGTYFIAIMVVMMTLYLSGSFNRGPGVVAETIIVTLICLLFLAIEVGCHIGVLLRVQALAAS